MRSSYRKKLDDLNIKLESLYRMYSYKKAAKLRRKRMKGGFNCDKEYKEEVLPYWRKFGLKPDKLWFEIFSDRDKKVDPRYIPDDLWYGKIVPYFSNTQFRRFGEDKCMHYKFFDNLKRPRTIVKNMACVFYDSNMNVIKEDKAIEIILSHKGEFLVKPSIDSGEGRLIHFFDENTNSKESIKEAIDNLKANYIFQESVEQHEDLKRLNPSSLNTIRVVTLFFKGEVHILSSILRIGGNGAKVDNIGAGGFACHINEDGKLDYRGVNRKAQWVTEGHGNIKFADVVVPSYNKILDLIDQTHKNLPHFKLIGWDFCIDKNGEPIFIEYNTCPGPNQITCGPTFGDITEEVLDEVFVKQSLKYAQN
ncbi:hexapeptide transferase [Anaerococcus sp. AGMB00486]|uniref:Hexapeptide transferase n=1 Tax=Anaerococcus faecalis TaxID=2742993 RepID=A0ABX2NA14_9FIRM|nr:sugar-transfer associated ATP-grasp domain-containing protein [Anaerococcus faecalis]NVF11536.1 hexapeptide transferase [Anaerococcus faecalis]